jgi:hypothetical protein
VAALRAGEFPPSRRGQPTETPNVPRCSPPPGVRNPHSVRRDPRRSVVTNAAAATKRAATLPAAKCRKPATRALLLASGCESIRTVVARRSPWTRTRRPPSHDGHSHRSSIRGRAAASTALPPFHAKRRSASAASNCVASVLKHHIMSATPHYRSSPTALVRSWRPGLRLSASALDLFRGMLTLAGCLRLTRPSAATLRSSPLDAGG